MAWFFACFCWVLGQEGHHLADRASLALLAPRRRGHIVGWMRHRRLGGVQLHQPRLPDCLDPHRAHRLVLAPTGPRRTSQHPIKWWLVAHHRSEQPGLVVWCDVHLVEEHLVEHAPDVLRSLPVGGGHVLGNI